MKLNDPVTGCRLTLYSMRGERDEINRADEESVVSCLMTYYLIDKEEAIRRLQNSDIDNPITYHDQIFWVE